MDNTEFCRKIETLLELDSGSIQPQTMLDRVEAWDSVSVISFIAMVDQDYGVSIRAKAIAECQTVGDLANVVAAGKAG